MRINNGFTLIEVLVVSTIIALLATIGITSYTSFNHQARDARRKADIEQIRGALELYRSNNGAYPTPAGSYGLGFGSGALTDSSNTYLSKLPADPQTAKTYYYTLSSGDYTLGAMLEGSSSCSASGTDCETTSGSQACNYCMGPYGAQ